MKMESKNLYVVIDNSKKEVTQRYDTDQNARIEIVSARKISWAVLRQLGYKCIKVVTPQTDEQNG